MPLSELQPDRATALRLERDDRAREPVTLNEIWSSGSRRAGGSPSGKAHKAPSLSVTFTPSPPSAA